MRKAIAGLLTTSSSRHRPEQIAAAVAMGALAGLLPKWNVGFGLLCCLCWLLPLHLPLAFITGAGLAMARGWLVPLAGPLGIWSLTHPAWRDVWPWLDTQPLVPWLGLHNSITHGSLLLGLGSWLPLYLITRRLAAQLLPSPQRPCVDRDFELELTPAVAGQLRCRDSNRSTADRSSATTERLCQQLEQTLAACRDDQTSALTAAEVTQRAADIAQCVDALLDACQEEDMRVARQSNVPESTQLLNPGSEPTPGPVPSGVASAGIGEVRRRHEQHVAGGSQPDTSPQVHPQEALRYLLHHLKAYQDRI